MVTLPTEVPRGRSILVFFSFHFYRLESENQALRDQLAAEKTGLKTNIDDNHGDSNRKINDLASKIARLGKESDKALRDFMTSVVQENQLLRAEVSKPLSVYFDAYRNEDYLDGGEDYLTFHGIKEHSFDPPFFQQEIYLTDYAKV